MLSNKIATQQDEGQIIALWDKSVTATHDFLRQEDKVRIRKEIPSYFPFLDIRLWYDMDNLLGFSGQNENYLEMLFIDPQFTAKGYGTAILQELITKYGITGVDVNEQNTVAKKFYLKNGFRIKGRSKLDDQNRPYPILHLSNKEIGLLSLRDAPFFLEEAATFLLQSGELSVKVINKVCKNVSMAMPLFLNGMW